jgi:hypothetical protein
MGEAQIILVSAGPISQHVSRCFHWLCKDEKSMRKSFKPKGVEDTCLTYCQACLCKYRAFSLHAHEAVLVLF